MYSMYLNKALKISQETMQSVSESKKLCILRGLDDIDDLNWCIANKALDPETRRPFLVCHERVFTQKHQIAQFAKLLVAPYPTAMLLGCSAHHQLDRRTRPSGANICDILKCGSRTCVGS